jgi:hypothetical protein
VEVSHPHLWASNIEDVLGDPKVPNQVAHMCRYGRLEFAPIQPVSTKPAGFSTPKHGGPMAGLASSDRAVATITIEGLALTMAP